MKKLGFLGGQFDPIHFGHLLVAQDAFEQMGLDKLYFVPAATTPLKGHDVTTSADDRLAMVQAAIDWDARFGVIDDELRRGGVSYTIDTVRELKRRFPDDRLFWVIGADQVKRLPKWKDVADLVRLVEFIYLERPGHPITNFPEISGLRLHAVRSHRIEMSSTELRERAGRRLSLHYFLPLKVNQLIESRALYRGTHDHQQ